MVFLSGSRLRLGRRRSERCTRERTEHHPHEATDRDSTVDRFAVAGTDLRRNCATRDQANGTAEAAPQALAAAKPRR